MEEGSCSRWTAGTRCGLIALGCRREGRGVGGRDAEGSRVRGGGGSQGATVGVQGGGRGGSIVAYQAGARGRGVPWAGPWRFLAVGRARKGGVKRNY